VSATLRLAIVAALVAQAAPASAQSAEAETLFREGRRLMKEGDFAAACDKLDASERLEPSAGTELNLADCREKNGQLATAWALFVKAAATARHSDGDKKREAEARRRAAELEPQLVHLRVVVPDDARVDGLAIKRNGEVVVPELWNQRVPVDAGSYEIVATAPGFESFETSVKVATRDKKVEIPPLDRAKHVQAKVKHDEREDDDRPAPAASARGPMTGARKAAIGLGIGGIALLAAGAGFGYHARDLESQSDQLCPDVKCRDATGVSLNQSAKTYGLYANIGFVAGGAAAATAIVLWFVGAPAGKETLAIVPRADGVGVAIGGAF
jgi:hypothetical protein